MILQTREHAAGHVGDFHTQVMTHESRRLAGNLMRWANTVIPWGVIPEMGQLLTTAKPVLKQNVLVPYRQDLVEVTGPDLQKRIRVKFGDATGASYTIIRRSSVPDFGLAGLSVGVAVDELDPAFNNQLLFGERCEYILWNNPGGLPGSPSEALLNNYSTWIVPIPDTLHPLTIQAPDRLLLEGVDFTVGDGALIFREHPHDLFGEKLEFMCRSALVDEPHLFDHIFSTAGIKDVSDIARIRHGKFGAKLLARAIARVAGLEVLDVESTLLEVITRCNGCYYRFDTGMVKAAYRHTNLIAGTTYPAGTIIGGEMIVVRRPVPGSVRWYRDGVDWNTGLSLDSFCAVPGLTAPDYPVRVEVTSSTGDLKHAQMWLLGTDEARARYWTMCKRAEQQTGLTLAAALGLANEGDVAVVNPIDVIFDLGALSLSALIVELKMSNLPSVVRRRVVEFLQREKPAASTLIIR